MSDESVHPRRVLFLAVGPSSMSPLDLDVEMREMRKAIERGTKRELEMRLETAVKISDLQHLLERERPSIVHFGGHGSDAREQLVFLDDSGQAFPVEMHALANVLSSFKSIEGVVLNACSSAKQAQAVAHRGGWAIGMDGRIEKEAAIIFSREFYSGLSDGKEPHEAFLRAASGLRLEGKVNASDRPCFFSEKRTQPSQLQLDVCTARLQNTNRELFGRDADLVWLDDCWKQGVRVASIVAFAGVGKTALVNAWLNQMSAAGWRGATRVFGWSFYGSSTERAPSSDEFVVAALKRFGDLRPESGSPWERGERLVDLVISKKTLLILDGLESLQSGPGPGATQGKLTDQALEALLRELARQAPGTVTCIVTSRIAIADLEGLNAPRMDLLRLEPKDGAQLLVARGASGDPADLEKASIDYGGHAFSLSLLGSYLRRAHKGDIRKRDCVLPSEAADHMMQTYERWFAGKPELAILRMTGLFAGPAHENEIAVLRAVPLISGLTDKVHGMTEGEWNAAVTTLREVGLLAPASENDEELDAHPLVRRHFAEQVRCQYPEAWREGHRRLYQHLCSTAREYPDAIEEMAPLYQAVVHGCLAGLGKEAFEDVFWRRIKREQRDNAWAFKHGAFGSDAAALSAYFESPWERLAPDLHGEWLTLVLRQAGFALLALGRLEESARLLRRAMERCAEVSDWLNAAAIASKLSDALFARGDLAGAESVATSAVTYADYSRSPYQCLERRTTLAWVLLARGERRRAELLFKEAEETHKKRRPHTPLLLSFGGYPYCDLLLDEAANSSEVIRRGKKTLPWVRLRRPVLDVPLNKLALGRAHLLQGDFRAAATWLREAVRGLRDAKRQHYLPLGLIARADLYLRAQTFELSRRDLDEALAVATRSGFRLHQADAHLGLARLALARRKSTDGNERLEEARIHLADARKFVEQTGYRRRETDLSNMEAELSRLAVSTPMGSAESSEVAPVSALVFPDPFASTREDLFDREAELQWLDDCWKNRVRVASLVGAGGVGTTILVNTWLTGMRDAGWLDATRVFVWSFKGQGTDRMTASDEFLDAALRWFKVLGPISGSAWDKGAQLAELVGGQRAILVLDGLEPLQWGTGVQEGEFNDHGIEALLKGLAAKNDGLCLITTRLEVKGLETSAEVRKRDLECISKDAAAALLKARGVTSEDDEELRKAAEEYGCHSLSLTLLGSYLVETANGDVLARRRIEAAKDPDGHGGPAWRVMAAYETLLGPGPELSVLLMIGLFDRTAKEDEIAALRVTPSVPGLTDGLEGVDELAWDRVVARLRRIGLLVRREGKGLDAHRMVREYFGRRLREARPDAWREGHRRLYEHLKMKAVPLPGTLKEMAPLYEAVVHGCLAGLAEDAFEKVYTERIERRDQYYNKNELGAFGSEVAVLSAFYDPPWERLVSEIGPRIRANMLGVAGYALGELGRIADATALCERSLLSYQETEDWRHAAKVAYNLAGYYQARGVLDSAMTCARAGVKHADDGGDIDWRVLNRTRLAGVYHAMGRWEDAAELFKMAEEIKGAVLSEVRLLESVAGFRFCQMLLDRGEHEEVRTRSVRSLDRRTVGYTILDTALDHLSLGSALLLVWKPGDGTERVTEEFRLAIEGLRRSGRQHYLALGLLARASLHRQTRAFDLADNDLNEVLALARRCDFRLHQADAYLGLARLALAKCEPAIAHLAQAREIVEQTGYHRRDADLRELQAVVGVRAP